jgi:hypothetical protein
VKINRFIFVSITLSILVCISCDQQKHHEPGNEVANEVFKKYWYSGKAEVRSYDLIQSRYGEDRQGKAVMIFVTEDLSINKQVKLDDPATAGKDKASVLKLNMTKNFITGIYPYSLMLSAFTPVDIHQAPHTLKLTMTAQEWCGHVFTQVNLRHKNYAVTSHSYFEKEADETLNLKVAWLEDELWNRIRLSPETLPVGAVDIIPGLFFSRVNHVGLDIEKAICTKEETPVEVTYTITYPSHQRSLTIGFEKAFPHRIKGWVEKYEQNGKTFTTTATLDKQLVTDYWTKNKNEFQYLRDSLGLSHQNY